MGCQWRGEGCRWSGCVKTLSQEMGQEAEREMSPRMACGGKVLSVAAQRLVEGRSTCSGMGQPQRAPSCVDPGSRSHDCFWEQFRRCYVLWGGLSSHSARNTCI